MSSIIIWLLSPLRLNHTHISLRLFVERRAGDTLMSYGTWEVGGRGHPPCNTASSSTSIWGSEATKNYTRTYKHREGLCQRSVYANGKVSEGRLVAHPSWCHLCEVLSYLAKYCQLILVNYLPNLFFKTSVFDSRASMLDEQGSWSIVIWVFQKGYDNLCPAAHKPIITDWADRWVRWVCS